MDIYDLVNKIFKSDPQPQKSIIVQFDNIGNTCDLFESLLLLFTEGMKIKYGNNTGKVNIDSLLPEQIYTIIRYFTSIGIRLHLHKFHIQQLEKFENTSNTFSPNVKYTYNITKRVSEKYILENYEENTDNMGELLTDYKKTTSDKLVDYKYKIRVGDNIYIIYFDYI